MSLGELLREFESQVRARFPDVSWSPAPGLDDAGIGRLRAAVAPFVLPAEVEELYRWHDGAGDFAVFAGNYLLPIEMVLKTRAMMMHQFAWPPSWLGVFAFGMGHGAVMMGLPGESDPDPTVWFGRVDSHVQEPAVVSPSGVVRACLVALERDLLELSGMHTLYIDGDSGAMHTTQWHEILTSLRVATPQYQAYIDGDGPRPFVELLDRRMPLPWLASYGLDADPYPRGATDTLADLIHRATTSPGAGPVRGSVRTRSLVVPGPRRGRLTLDDGTARLTVDWGAPTLLGPPLLETLEIDLVLRPAPPETESQDLPDPAHRIIGTCTGARLIDGIDNPNVIDDHNLIPTTQPLRTNGSWTPTD